MVLVLAWGPALSPAPGVRSPHSGRWPGDPARAAGRPARAAPLWPPRSEAGRPVI